MHAFDTLLIQPLTVRAARPERSEGFDNAIKPSDCPELVEGRCAQGERYPYVLATTVTARNKKFIDFRRSSSAMTLSASTRLFALERSGPLNT